MRRRGCFAGSGFVAAMLLGGCAPALTEIVVVVDSDLPVPAAMDEVDIRVANDLAMSTTAVHSLIGASAGTLPATVGLRPRQDESALVTITAAARLAGADVVTAEVRTHFVPGRRIVLQIFLASSCRMVTCVRGMTCRAGTCVDSNVDPSTLPSYMGHLPDAGADAAVRDAGDAGPHDGGPTADSGSDAGGCTRDPSCDDHLFCNGVERCLGGTCGPGTLPSCDDGIACTADSCDPTINGCAHMALDALCTLVAGGHCDVAHGGCQYPTCDATTCVPTTGACETATCSGTACERASTCTGGQMCCGGACVASGCDDGNACTDDSCIPTGCAHVNNTAVCSDGNSCTTGDRCSAGVCAGTAVACDDGVACTHDSCGGGVCLHVNDDTLCTMSAGGTCDPMRDCQYPTCTMTTCANDPASCLTASCAGPTCNRVSTCAGTEMCCGGSCVPAGCDDGNPCTTDSCVGTSCTHTAIAGGSCAGGTGVCNAGACCTGCIAAGACQAGTADGACGYGGHACSPCPCASGVCSGGDNCLSYFDVSTIGTTVLAIDTCAETNNFDFTTCSDGPPPPPFTPDAVLSGTSPGNYFITAEPGFTIGSLTDTGACTSGILSCSAGGTWGTAGGSGSGRFYWGVERTSGGCGRVTITVTRS